MQNIPSIAFSIDSFNPKSFDTSKSIIRQIINLAIENRITKNSFGMLIFQIVE